MDVSRSYSRTDRKFIWKSWFSKNSIKSNILSTETLREMFSILLFLKRNSTICETTNNNRDWVWSLLFTNFPYSQAGQFGIYKRQNRGFRSTASSKIYKVIFENHQTFPKEEYKELEDQVGE